MTDTYEILRRRLEEFPIPVVPGKGVLEFLKIVYSEHEALLLSKFKSFFKFMTVEEFARENDLDVTDVKVTFRGLAKRSMIRYKQDASGNDLYLIHPFVVGIFEAFFSSWEKQNPSSLVPAAKAAEGYFDSVFYKAASNSTSPWARVIPSIKGIESLLQEHPGILAPASSEISVSDHLQKSVDLVKYGTAELGKKLASGKLEDALGMLKSDGPVIMNAIATSISSLFSPRRPAPQKSRANGTDVASTQGKFISIDEAVPARLMVFPFEVIRSYVDITSDIVVTNCSCREKNRLLCEDPESQERNKPARCKHPVEGTCMQFLYDGERGHEYNMWGGRHVTRQEAMEILEKCERAGLVHTTFNSREKIEFICNCCPCCCGILSTLTRHHQRYNAFIESNFLPRRHPEQCVHCGSCAAKCPVGAIAWTKGTAPSFDLGRCIGCGVCVSACNKGALSLKKVKNNVPAIDVVDTHIKFANGKLRT